MSVDGASLLGRAPRTRTVAERFYAGAIGVAACKPMLNLHDDGYIAQSVKLVGDVRPKHAGIFWMFGPIYAGFPAQLRTKSIVTACSDLIKAGAAACRLGELPQSLSNGSACRHCGMSHRDQLFDQIEQALAGIHDADADA